MSEEVSQRRRPKLFYLIPFILVFVGFPALTMQAYLSGSGYPFYLTGGIAFIPGLLGGSVLWLFSALGLWIIVDGMRGAKNA